MGVSKGTVWRFLQSARKKTAAHRRSEFNALKKEF